MTKMKAEGKKSGRVAKAAPKSRQDRGPTKVDIESLAILFGLGRTSVRRKRIKPDTKLPLTLSEDERKLILSTWSISGGLTDTQLRALEIPPKPELHLTLGDWDDLGGWVAATSNHARGGTKLQKRACALFGRIQELLDNYTDE